VIASVSVGAGFGLYVAFEVVFDGDAGDVGEVLALSAGDTPELVLEPGFYIDGDEVVGVF